MGPVLGLCSWQETRANTMHSVRKFAEVLSFPAVRTRELKKCAAPPLHTSNSIPNPKEYCTY